MLDKRSTTSMATGRRMMVDHGSLNCRVAEASISSRIVAPAWAAIVAPACRRSWNRKSGRRWVHWFNHERIHESIDDLTPIEVEQARYSARNRFCPTG